MDDGNAIPDGALAPTNETNKAIEGQEKIPQDNDRTFDVNKAMERTLAPIALKFMYVNAKE